VYSKEFYTTHANYGYRAEALQEVVHSVTTPYYSRVFHVFWYGRPLTESHL